MEKKKKSFYGTILSHFFCLCVFVEIGTILP